ncbi:hypothetical protein AAZV13_04G024300 [Glycine max]
MGMNHGSSSSSSWLLLFCMLCLCATYIVEIQDHTPNHSFLQAREG